MPSDKSEDREWGWFPRGEGRDYQLTNPLRPLAPLRDEVTIPIEEAVKDLEGVVNIESTTTSGMAFVVISGKLVKKPSVALPRRTMFRCRR